MSKKSIRLGKSLMYELLLLMDRYKGFGVRTMYGKLPKGYCSEKTLYNYHLRWLKADKKARELSKDW